MYPPGNGAEPEWAVGQLHSPQFSELSLQLSD